MKSWGMRRRTANLVLDDFEMRDAAAGHPGEGQILARTLFISLDPYLTRAMKSWEGEVPGWADGAVHGRLIAEVVESRAFGLARTRVVEGKRVSVGVDHGGRSIIKKKNKQA